MKTKQNIPNVRESVVEGLADLVRTCNDVGAGSTICTLNDWKFWEDSLTLEEHKLLYKKLREKAVELYESKGYNLVTGEWRKP